MGTEGIRPGGEWEWMDPHRLRPREAFEFALDAQLVTDAQGIILVADHASGVVLQCAAEFLAGKPLGLFVASGYRARFYEALARLHGSSGSDEFSTRTSRSGVLRDVAVWVTASEPADVGRTVFRWTLRDISERRRAADAREDLLRRLVTAQEDEQARIAREMHDTFGQLLSALLLGVRAARDAGPLPAAALARLDEVERIADELGKTSHDLATRLRPTALDDVGLDSALLQYTDTWSARTGVEVQFQTIGMTSERLPRGVETALYRVVQEALTNVSRHARARVVSVIAGRQDGHAVAVIEDDGVGFEPEKTGANPKRLGLIGMSERLALEGGRLEVESTPGAGTTVIARIPVHRASEPGRG